MARSLNREAKTSCCADHIVHAADIEEGFLLAGERGVRKVFGGSGGTHCHGEVVVAVGQGGEGLADLAVETGRELGFHHPLADLRAGLGQGVDVVDVQGVQGRVDTVVEATLLEEVTVGLGGGGKSAGYGNAGTGQVADHLAEGCVLAPHMLYIMDAELIEGNYVLYQGDLSTIELEKLKRGQEQLRWILAWPLEISDNAATERPLTTRGLS